MKKEAIKETVENFAERRMESFIQAFMAVLSDHETKIVKAVEEQVKVTVNGKIDKIQKEIEGMRADINMTKPLVSFKDWIYAFFKGLLWIGGGVVTIGGAIVVLVKLFTK